MKHLKETEVWQKEKLARDHRLAVMMMIRQQIDMVGQLMERHKELVKAPLSYNMCVGLLEQLQGHSFAAFNETGAAAPYTPDGIETPYFKFPNEIVGL
jgi:hypothetical protein